MIHYELRDWLRNQDAETRVAIAAQVAARVWPLTISGHRLPEPGFSAARAILITALAIIAHSAAKSAAITTIDAAAMTAHHSEPGRPDRSERCRFLRQDRLASCLSCPAP